MALLSSLGDGMAKDVMRHYTSLIREDIEAEDWEAALFKSRTLVDMLRIFRIMSERCDSSLPISKPEGFE